MKKIILTLLLAFSLSACSQPQETKEVAKENVGETPTVVTEKTPIIEMEKKTDSESSVKLQDLGEVTLVKSKDFDDLEFLNENIKIEVDEYKLSTVKLKDEYKHLFKDTFGDVSELSILGIWLDFDNITNKDITLENVHGTIEINTGEVQTIEVEFDDGLKNIVLDDDDDEEGTIIASFATPAEKITEVILKLEGFKEIKFNL